MTLVAIACHDDRAEVVTDSLAGNPNNRHTWSIRGGKVHPLGDLPAVATATGNSGMGLRWTLQLSDLALLGQSVDELVTAADPQGCQIDGPTGLRGADSGICYLVGYSEQRQRFCAWTWAAFTDWQPVELNHLHIQPHPYGRARTDDMLERRIAHTQATSDVNVDGIELPDGPDLPIPVTAVDWKDLVRIVRRTRAMFPKDMRLRNEIGGAVTRTTITRDDIAVDRIHTLDHADRPASAGFRAMMTYTFHPTFQLATCRRCRSGKPMAECCGPRIADKPCTCGSGQRFGDCCLVKVGEEHPPFIEVVPAVWADGHLSMVYLDHPAAHSQRCPECGSWDAIHRYATDVTGATLLAAECIDCRRWWYPPAIDVVPAHG